jgi:hypothetical protein
VNVADEALAATATDAGTLSAVLLAESATTAPPAAAGAVRVTRQLVAAPLDKVALPQVTEAMAGVAAGGGGNAAPEPATLPLVAATAIACPDADTPIVFTTVIAAELAPGASVTATVAATPLAMIPEFIPDVVQVYVPDAAEQVSDFPAAVNAGPAVTTRLDTAADE